MMGETSENLAEGLDTYSYKQPLGVCAGICPFNFPAMIPLWMFPVAVREYLMLIVRWFVGDMWEHLCAKTLREGPHRRHETG